MKNLTKTEEQVMQLLWKLQQGFLKDILENSPEPKPHSNTIATILKILVEKGFVAYETQGRNNLYKPKISKAEYGKKSINQIVKGYFEGSPARLVSQFLTDNKLTVEELEDLARRLNHLKNQNNGNITFHRQTYRQQRPAVRLLSLVFAQQKVSLLQPFLFTNYQPYCINYSFN